MKLVQNSEKIDELIMAQRASGVLCEKLLSKLYHLHLKPGDRFIDVGARVGLHLFPMAKIVGPTGKGLGIEANPKMAEGLIEKIRDKPLKTIDIAAVAVGETKGKADFFIMEDYNGWSSLYAQHIHPKESKTPQTIRVTIETIDDLFAARGWTACDFIKLDIENAEFPSLRGAAKTIATHRPLLVFENSPVSAAKLNGYSADDFFAFFEGLNYDILDIFLNKFTPERWKTEKRLPSYYVAYPRENNPFESKSIVREYDEFLVALQKKQTEDPLKNRVARKLQNHPRLFAAARRAYRVMKSVTGR